MPLGDPKGFPQVVGAEVRGMGSATALHDFMVGTGKQIGRAVPPPVRAALRAAATAPGPMGQARTEPATVLLFTEDPYVPWELAVLDPPLHTAAGRDSPFPAAHVTIGRWPLTETKPRPLPRLAVDGGTRAVLTAKYEGVTR